MHHRMRQWKSSHGQTYFCSYFKNRNATFEDAKKSKEPDTRGRGPYKDTLKTSKEQLRLAAT